MSKIKFPISLKIASTIGLILISFGIFCIINVVQMKNVDSSYNNLLDRRELVIENVQQLQLLMAKLEITAQQMILTSNYEEISAYDELRNQFEQTLAEFEATSPNAKSQEQIDLLKDRYTECITVLDEALERQIAPSEIISYFKTADLKGKHDLFHEQAEAILEIANGVMSNDRLATQEKTSSIMKTIIIAVVVFLVIGAILGYAVGRNISKPITILANRMHKLAQGDFTLEPLHLKNKDEIGWLTQSSNTMMEQVQGMFKDVQSSSHNIVLATDMITNSTEQAREVSTNVAQIAQKSVENTENQLLHFEQAHEQMQHVTDEIIMIEKESNDMQRTNAHTLQLSKQGEQIINEVLGSMEEINEVSQTIESISNELEDYSRNIDEMLSLITSISDQTNLLALNASIEAARAGEAGKGFAVVADEVRNLAEESRKSAEQVREVVGYIQKGTKDLSQNVLNSRNTVSTGLSISANAHSIFNELNGSIDQLTSTTTQVSKSIGRVRKIHETLANTIDQTKIISYEAQDTAQQTTAAAQEQQAISDELTKTIASFNEIAEILMQNAQRVKVQE